MIQCKLCENTGHVWIDGDTAGVMIIAQCPDCHGAAGKHYDLKELQRELQAKMEARHAQH